RDSPSPRSQARPIISKQSQGGKGPPQQVRIISGQYRRTPLAVPGDVPGLRPTPDRVRETLFNWLNHLWDADYSVRKVLDLYAGSGALGFEAASRGAAQAVLVETDRRALAQLELARQKLKAESVVIEAQDALAYLRRAASSGFDLIFLDPPFGQGRLEPLWQPVASALAPDGLVYVEAEAHQAPPGFTIVRESKAGAVHFHLLEKAADAS